VTAICPKRFSRTLLRFGPGAANRKSSHRQRLIVSSASMSDVVLSIVLGVALAAATGFRVFLPMLIVGGAAYTGHLHLDDGFAWLGSPSALIMLSVAASWRSSPITFQSSITCSTLCPRPPRS
jgi:Domain of unknown function (DUF4126)